MPWRASWASCIAAAPGRSRGGSISSMRINHLPSCARASSQLARAAAREPRCSGPVGEGANRPRYTRIILIVFKENRAAHADFLDGCLLFPREWAWIMAVLPSCRGIVFFFPGTNVPRPVARCFACLHAVFQPPFQTGLLVTL